jgi:hypothetical protein
MSVPLRDPAGQTGLVADPARDPAPDPKPPTRSHTSSPLRQTRSLFDWLFHNRQTGQITIAQFPNVPLWIFLLTVVLRWVVPNGTAARTALDWTALAALAWWALDEVFRGVNPWRRLLGLGGCVFVAAGLASLL